MVPPTPYTAIPADLLWRMVDLAPPVMVVVSVPELRIILANQAGHRAARDESQDLAGRPVGDVFPFVDPALVRAAARSAPQRSAAPARAVVDQGGGSVTWWDVSYAPLTLANVDAATVLVTAVDVTAQATAMAEARTARDTLDALLAYIPEGISVSQGPDVRVTRVSAQGAMLTGRDEAELTGQSVLRHPDAWQVYRPGTEQQLAPEDRPLARATRTGEVTMNETLLIRRPDGSFLPVLCNSGPIRDSAGRVTGAVLAWRDISALQHAESALRSSEERLRAVLLQIPAAIFIVEAPDARVTFKSKLVDEVLGCPDPDLTAALRALRGWAIHADGSPYDIQEYPSRRALYKGETVQAEPMTYSRGDGRLIDLEVYAGPVRDAGGDVVAAVVATLDVTERNLAAARLLESEAHLRVALEAGGLGTWEVDLIAGTTHLGRSLAIMLGMPAEPVAWDRAEAASFIHPDDRARVSETFTRALAEGDAYFCEFRAHKVDGSTRWFVSRGRIIRAPNGSPTRAVGVIRDVTERRLREDHLREAIEARELLLREADHRIKNSLQLVGSLLGLQRSRVSDPDAVAALDGAISRVMAVSQAHMALHQSSDLRHVALDDMLRDLCAHVGTLNPALRFLCDCPPALQLDTERAIPLGLVVSELLTNAAKHAYPLTSGEVRTIVSAERDMVEIVVSDTGVGMATSGTSRARLGSTIVRALVTQIGAEMDVTSSPGQGTRTRLRFSQRPSAPGT